MNIWARAQQPKPVFIRSHFVFSEIVIQEGPLLTLLANIGIFDKLTNDAVTGSPLTVNLDHIETIQKGGNVPCIINPPIVCYQVGFYYLHCHSS